MKAWRRYLRFFGPNVDADVDDELRFHLEARIAEYERSGMTRDDAERVAHERFGDLANLERQLRSHDRVRLRRLEWKESMDRLTRDLRTVLRGLGRAPAFFTTAIVILGLAIGMSVAMFTVFRTVLVRRLPVVDQDRIAVMWTYRQPTTDLVLGPKYLVPLRRQSRTMRDLAAVAHWPPVAWPIIDGTRSLSLNASLVTANFFEVLGARAVVGRLFRSSDQAVGPLQPDGNNVSKVIVLTYRAWQREYGGDPAVVGRQVVDATFHWRYTIVGVAPPGLEYPSGVDFWEPTWTGWDYDDGGSFVVARLAPGASIHAAADEYLGVMNREAPGLKARGVHAATLADTILGNVRPVLLVLTAAVALLLVIACLNVGNLLLLRASSRAREIAIRRALGATSADITRHFFIEAVALAVAGGAVGLGVSVALLRIAPLVVPQNLPRLDELRLSGTPVLTAIAIASAAVLMFGVLPALVAARGGLASPLRFDARSGSETRRRRATRESLVASQVALAMIMLGGAALLGRSLARLEGQDLGYASDHLSILSFSFDLSKYDTPSRDAALEDQLQSRLRAVPGVVASSPLLDPPLLGTAMWQVRFDREDQAQSDYESNPAVSMEMGGPDCFKTLQIPIVRGRGFAIGDRATAPLVAVVSESFAREYWPGQDPIGKRIRLTHATAGDIIGGNGWRTVVGLVHDTHMRDLHETTPTVYLPVDQGVRWNGYYAIHSTVPLAALLPALRAAGHETDPLTELYHADTMDELLATPLAEPRLGALLMSSFGLVALLLAAIGLYGVMASLVRDQTREIGIRIALGATRARVLREVLGRAAVLTGVGALVGLAAALATSRLFTAMLFEVSPTDPVALGGACVVLLVVGALAAWLPARRATRVDPVNALRTE